jgi:hypothetical protein
MENSKSNDVKKPKKRKGAKKRKSAIKSTKEIPNLTTPISESLPNVQPKTLNKPTNFPKGNFYWANLIKPPEKPSTTNPKPNIHLNHPSEQ